MTLPIMQIRDLSVSFQTTLGKVLAADGVDLELLEGETLALVGETGCGKSVVASSILKILPRNAKVEGEILFQGKDLLKMGEREIARIRGSRIAVIFQNPSLALNPVLSIGSQISEPFQVHRSISRKRAMSLAEDLLRRLGLGDDRLMGMYPFQFSGGMNQRAMVAASLALGPEVLIADEPTKGLDSSISRSVMVEISKAKEFSGSSLILITHDLTLARNISDRMAIMYCGQIMEMGRKDEIFEEPLHPYTQALLGCMPERGFNPIPGSSPSMICPPEGCRFGPRCPFREAACQDRQSLKKLSKSGGRRVRCRRF
jgi:peptide/nickel transport system ATP-binding protein